MPMAEITRRIERGGLSEEDENQLWECLYFTTDEVTEFLEFVKSRNRYPFIYPELIFIQMENAWLPPDGIIQAIIWSIKEGQPIKTFPGRNDSNSVTLMLQLRSPIVYVNVIRR